ncbi:MAG: PQQ-dependent sugar dehydrogenase [Chloroflexi bacterium]|nr:PQQ-dependent sugar dehydrogenase [Chloroflexota bacterium]
MGTTLCNTALALALLAAALAATLLNAGAVSAGSATARPSGITVPEGFQVDEIANVFEWPTAFAFLPDGRILVGEKGGMLKMMVNGTVLAQPVIDLRSQVNDYVDRGFVDVAVDPDFTRNHYLYLFYTYKPVAMPHDSPDKVMGRIERYVLDGNVIRRSSVKIILDDFESTRENHSVDSIRWTPEGYMFVSFGEGAPSLEVTDLAVRAQNIDNLQGKIIRINKEDGTGVPGNPFYDAKNPKSARSRVWSYGLRNPFRFGVHPVTGIPYVGNVGWATYESLYRALPGTNFGWPCVEGILNRPEYQVKPGCKGVNITNVDKAEYDYPHMGNNASITGGDFNFATNFPDSMYGDYFFGDYSIQWLRRAVLDEEGKVVRVEEFAQGMGEPVDIKFGPDGMLYYLSIYSGGLRRISYKNGNHVPDVKLSATPIAGRAPLTVKFSAAGSTDPDKDKITYEWDFGDGAKMKNTSADGEVIHLYTANGQYIVRLTATDARGGKRVAETLITAGDAAPQVAITSPGNGSVYLPGQNVKLAGKASDLLGNTLSPERMSWRVTYHDGSAARVLTETTGATVSFTMPDGATSNNPFVEALFSARSAGGKISATHIDLYLPSEDGYIRTWWLSSGFLYGTLDDDRMPGGEAAYTAKPGDWFMQLVRTDPSSHRVNLANYITPAYKAVAYGFIWVDVLEDRKGLLGMLSDDGIAVWLNGKEIWRNKISRYMPDDTRDIDLPPIELKKGLNALLVKVDQNDGDWAFKVRVLNPDGSIMQDATVKSLAP